MLIVYNVLITFKNTKIKNLIYTKKNIKNIKNAQRKRKKGRERRQKGKNILTRMKEKYKKK